jgi:uncharacterized protein (DUF1330 family)
MEYLERIEATLAPYDGHFIVHGGPAETLEGNDPGAVIVIEFPDRSHAQDWYTSPAYREILPLRTENATSKCSSSTESVATTERPTSSNALARPMSDARQRTERGRQVRTCVAGPFSALRASFRHRPGVAFKTTTHSCGHLSGDRQ